MSNRVNVEVEKVDEGMWDVKVSDDYDAGNIVLFDQPPDSDVDLLKIIKVRAYEDARLSPQADRVKGILEFIEEHAKGLTIRDTYYDFSEVAEAFEEAA